MEQLSSDELKELLNDLKYDLSSQRTQQDRLNTHYIILCILLEDYIRRVEADEHMYKIMIEQR